MNSHELRERIRKSGMIDGVFHHAAAINPCTGIEPDYRYPDVYYLDSDSQIMQWVFFTDPQLKLAAFGWLGNPITALGDVSKSLDFTVQDFLDELGKQNKTMEEARDAVLAEWEHSEVHSGTIKEFMNLFKN